MDFYVLINVTYLDLTCNNNKKKNRFIIFRKTTIDTFKLNLDCDLKVSTHSHDTKTLFNASETPLDTTV